MSDYVRVTQDGDVLSILLDRPEKKNALTQSMYMALTSALKLAAEHADIRVVLITGAGDTFTSGNDIADFQGEMSVAFEFGRHLMRLELPIVAAVNGAAIGIGATMLLHCDIVYAAAGARFRFPFVDLGLVPEIGSSMLLPRIAGYHRAAELMLLSDFCSAETALEIGLINRIVPPDMLMEQATSVARALAAKPRDALLQTRALLRGDQSALLDHMDREAEILEQRRQSPEAQARFAAFLARARR